MDWMEGQKYDDNDYNRVYNLLENCDTKIEIQNVEWNENLIHFEIEGIDCKCGPSMLSELINSKDNYTQIFVSYICNQKEEIDIYVSAI